MIAKSRPRQPFADRELSAIVKRHYTEQLPAVRESPPALLGNNCCGPIGAHSVSSFRAAAAHVAVGL
jgi:hypothetical protein